VKHVILVILLFSPFLSWGEDSVWYCVEELNYALEDENGDGIYKLKQYSPAKFTFKYEQDKDRLAIFGRTWSGVDQPYYIECDTCSINPDLIDAANKVVRFSMWKGRFFDTTTSYIGASMKSGTCTKF